MIHDDLQVDNVPSNLRIVDYSHGMTGSAHDATAFKHTAAAKYPEWFFSGEEFTWANSAYAVNHHTIPVHKEPASFQPHNKIFDKAVSHLHVRSEHCMGALKTHFQCLRGPHIKIRSKQDHAEACHWITIAIILHNFIIDIEGLEGTQDILGRDAGGSEDSENDLLGVEEEEELSDDADAKRRQLVAEIVAFKGM